MPFSPLTTAFFPARLRGTLGALVLGLLPLAGWAQTASAPASELLEQAVLEAANAYREVHGLAPLQPDDALHALAVTHSHEMAQRRQLSHDGFDGRFRRSGRALCVENLAARHDHSEALLAAWQISAAHQANLLEPRVRQVGIARVGHFLTLLACTARR